MSRVDVRRNGSVSRYSADRAPAYGRYGIVGRSPEMQRVYEDIEAVAPTRAPVLIVGETGTGKELVARAIHSESRYSGSFVAINCSAIPDGLLESELFGHVRGAYSGADHSRIGKLEAANGGTVFLDEIGELLLPSQAKLLRVLQEKEVTPLGANHPTPVDFRVVAATNRDLYACSQKGEFREDLYYRLAVFPIALPPLRERSGDVRVLSEHFVREYNNEYDLDLHGIDGVATELLGQYEWRGNVRELAAVIGSAMIRKRQQRRKEPDSPNLIDRGDVERAIRSRFVRASDSPTPRLPLAESFWDAVARPYAERLITKSQVREIVSSGLEQSGGLYIGLLSLFKLPESDYRKLMAFLRRHDCYVDFRSYRRSRSMNGG